jgi:hypothetical protein
MYALPAPTTAGDARCSARLPVPSGFIASMREEHFSMCERLKKSRRLDRRLFSM